MKMCLNSLGIKGMQTKTTKRQHCVPSRKAKTGRTENAMRLQGCGPTGALKLCSEYKLA